eukprot:CAMPEP_0172911654 /NCGR_PEP_ID=MMETSP1075-20121228/186966_1 /TAXON_ID=2916 /ORGANISM="Ceratium fusus, Strain PA161109" /LENGTH=62 /DNA_ID=CAMNT_0013770017 /DNA_START=113 /DNA_END=297 /DNA_ORIENTATION=+
MKAHARLICTLQHFTIHARPIGVRAVDTGTSKETRTTQRKLKMPKLRCTTTGQSRDAHTHDR